jgi:hypothetical protein
MAEKCSTAWISRAATSRRFSQPKSIDAKSLVGAQHAAPQTPRRKLHCAFVLDANEMSFFPGDAFICSTVVRLLVRNAD